MKIKFGFITNSSSTVFIVFIPDDFYLSSSNISKLLEEEIAELVDMEELNTEEKEKLIPSIEYEIEALKEGEQYSYDSQSPIDVSEWRVIMRICEDNGFVLSSVELPMDSSDAVIGLTQEAIIRTLTAHIDLDKFMKPFIKNKEDKKV